MVTVALKRESRYRRIGALGGRVGYRVERTQIVRVCVRGGQVGSTIRYTPAVAVTGWPTSTGAARAPEGECRSGGGGIVCAFRATAATAAGTLPAWCPPGSRVIISVTATPAASTPAPASRQRNRRPWRPGRRPRAGRRDLRRAA